MTIQYNGSSKVIKRLCQLVGITYRLEQDESDKRTLHLKSSDGSIDDTVTIPGDDITVDDALSGTSENPVQNKVISNEIKNLKRESHTHENKDVIDSITIDDYTNWQSAKNKAHTHDNKDALDRITDTDVSSWIFAYLQTHKHENKDVLDSIADFDTTPTKNSTNPVTSNGIYTAIARSRANITAVSVDVDVTADMWQDGAITITSSEIHADSVVTVGLQLGTATAELVQSVGNALIVAKSQADGAIVLECLGTIPTITIPITLTILTDTSYAVIQTIEFTVKPSDWVDGVATLTDANFLTDSIVDIGLQVGAATADIAKAAASATIAAQSQTDGSITLVCLGTVPAVALPLSVTVINVGG